ncbi:hypothetical protein [Dinoroseobacter sp. S124A]|uniref:hypothetical protein n=1 Tax=Dinoroseobacter sp. S124A TaxID=3415128 RepID=UPI003C798FD5
MLNLRWTDDTRTAVVYEEDGRSVVNQGELLRKALAGKISVGKPAKPEPDRASMTLTMPQLLIGLKDRGWITEAEGDAWAAATALPASALAVVATLPADAQYAARMRLLRMSKAERTSDLVQALAAAEGVSDTELDAFFAEFATA